jgi:hypothetical protein
MNRSLDPVATPFRAVEASERNTRNLGVGTGLVGMCGVMSGVESGEKDDQPISRQVGEGMQGVGYSGIQS